MNPHQVKAKRLVILESLGFDSKDYLVWARKWKGLIGGQRGTGQPYLTFKQYLKLARRASITKPGQIGKKPHLFQMGRYNDIGLYVWGNCRFITMRQNHDERVLNGGAQRAGDTRKGMTKDNHRGVASMARKLTGRNKTNHPSIAARAKRQARKFYVVDPGGVVYRSRNLKAFCAEHDLSFPAMCRVMSGEYSHHRGWTGHYRS